MKQLHGAASTTVAVPVQQCVSLLAAVDGYPSWYPAVVKNITVLDRDAQEHPSRARATLHVSVGPLVRDFDLLLAVGVEPPGTVTLTRVPHDPSDSERFEVRWRVSDAAGAGGTEIELELDANLSVPRLLPLGDVGATLAQGFVDAAARALGT